MEITKQDSIEFVNNRSAQDLLNERLQAYLSVALSCAPEEHEKRLEALTAHKVLKDYADKLSAPANRKYP